MKIQNCFTILISTRNAGTWIEKCIDSAGTQDYPIDKFDIIFLDAQSSDGTFEKAKDMESKYSNLQCFQNEKRKYQGENILIGTKMAKEKSIISTLDGDDFYPHNNVLSRVNVEYNKGEVFMTYGTYEEFHGDDVPRRDVRWHYHAYPKDVVENKTFRQHSWLASHLRTFRRELFLKINEQDLKDDLTGDFLSFAADLSFQYPMLEMCGNKSRYIPDILYVYNRCNENSETYVNQPEIDRIEKQLRARTPYQTLDKLYDDEQ